MKKTIKYSARGQSSHVGEVTIARVLPNGYSEAVGPFVFLDYVLPTIKETVMKANGGGAHPHRGIATLTYVLNGEAEWAK